MVTAILSSFNSLRYYINYKLLKKTVKRYSHEIEVGRQDHHHILKDFSRLLDKQVKLLIL